MIATIPFTPETVAVQRPTFESIADDLEAYQETLQCMEASPEYDLDRAECEQHIERLSEALLKKTDDLACVLRRMKADAGTLKAEETRLRERRTVVEASLERLKSYTLVTMESHGFNFMKTPKNTISIRGNGGLTPLHIDETLLPEEFKDSVVVQKVNSARVRASLDSGEGVPGAHFLPRGRSVVVR